MMNDSVRWNILARSFDALAQEYDSIGRLHRFDSRIACMIPGNSKAVLDLGCGSGTIAQLVATSKTHVVGVDISSRMLDCARKRCAGKNAEFLQIPIEKIGLHFSDNQFDAIIASKALHHCEKIGDVIECCSRLLKRDGRMIIFDLKVTSRESRSRISWQQASKDMLFCIANGIASRNLIAYVADFCREARMMRSPAWIRHCEVEPGFDCNIVVEAMKSRGLLTQMETAGSRFTLIVGHKNAYI